ncbi:transglycosylase SLT domain-containing protein [Trinickia sp. NRRL B-1857]|uniref:lytic transglycosylase domain-containing protein n=1 Tax=Trinickia sp. NRRL B-1857 TaxID=3162879 RepID=UPI003D2C0D39
MTRLFFALLLSFGLAASASAFAQESEASRVLAASAGVSASAPSEASGAVAASDGAAVTATGTGSGQVHRIREMLTQKFGLARAKAEQISSAVMTSASKYSLPPALVLAIISIESRFQDHARGRHGATGLMQVVPAAHKRLVKNLDLTEPATNIEAGSAILHGYLESARGDVGAALKSYGGSTAYARKVSLRAKDFEVVDSASDATAASAAR